MHTEATQKYLYSVITVSARWNRSVKVPMDTDVEVTECPVVKGKILKED